MPHRSWTTQVIYAVLIGVQIYAACAVFGKWTDDKTKTSSSDMIYKGGAEDDMTTAIGRSYYKDKHGHYRGKFEMKLKVSTMLGGTDFDAHSATIRFEAAAGLPQTDCVYPVFAICTTRPAATCATARGQQMPHRDGYRMPRDERQQHRRQIASDHFHRRRWLRLPQSHAAGPTADSYPTLRDAACSDHGVCILGGTGGTGLTGGCVCELGRYGSYCEGELSNLDKVQYNDGTLTAPTGGIDASTLAADVHETTASTIANPTQAQLNLETHVHVGPYSTLDSGYDDYSDLNVVVLAGVYLILSIVLIAYTLLGTWQTKSGEALGIPTLVSKLVGSAGVNQFISYLDPLPELVLAGLSAAVVVAGISSFQWQRLAEGIPTYVNATGDGNSETLGIEEPPLLSFERLMVVVTLTVVSRTASYMRSKSDVNRVSPTGPLIDFNAEFISVSASVVNILYMLAILDDRTDRMKQLATPIFIAFFTFEVIYLVTVVATRVSTLSRHDESSMSFVGENMIVAACQALAIVLALYVSSRRAANLYDTSTSTLEVLEGSPFMQLGHRADLCDFIDSDILAAPKTDAEAITEQWAGHRACFTTNPITGNTTYVTRCCTANTGTAQAWLRASIWVPLTICLVALLLVSFDTIRLIRARLTDGGTVSGLFKFVPSFMKPNPDGMPSRYSRIRVRTSLS